MLTFGYTASGTILTSFTRNGVQCWPASALSNLIWDDHCRWHVSRLVLLSTSMTMATDHDHGCQANEAAPLGVGFQGVAQALRSPTMTTTSIARCTYMILTNSRFCFVVLLSTFPRTGGGSVRSRLLGLRSSIPRVHPLLHRNPQDVRLFPVR